MSNPGSMSGINKIHINNSTKISLSDRFTAFSAQPKIQPRTSHRGVESPVSRVSSIANRRLLKQLAQKHTREAALKLKRRSMKPRQTAAYNRVTNGVQIKRGTIKALRLGPSGRLMKANSITNVATMEADFMGRPPRRSNSTSRIAERIGGGVARRVGRPLWRANTQANYERTPPPRATRSRSRSRTRRISALLSPSSAQAGIGQRTARPRRSNSRPRVLNRSRSRSSRVDRMLKLIEMRGSDTVPITSRLGVRAAGRPIRARSASRGRTVNARQGIASGRIQKRRASVKAMTAGGDSLASNVRNRISRPSGRYEPKRPAPPAKQKLNARFSNNRPNTTRGRARSRSRTGGRLSQKANNGVVRGGVAARQRGGAQRGGRGGTRGVVARGGRRGRSQQRGGAQQRNGNGAQTQQLQQQQRRGRSRSRGRKPARGGRQIGKPKPEVKKEDLDKELDQYMSSTKNTDV